MTNGDSTSKLSFDVHLRSQKQVLLLQKDMLLQRGLLPFLCLLCVKSHQFVKFSLPFQREVGIPLIRLELLRYKLGKEVSQRRRRLSCGQ